VSAKRKRLEPLSEALAAYLESSGIGAGARARAVFTEWRERVGDRIAGVATPLRLDRGTLVVGVRSSAWLMELKLMERQLVERINADLDEGRIEKIRLVLAHADEGNDTGRNRGEIG
jgi:predicted nucleic acid-binding Zn ribbon protein